MDRLRLRRMLPATVAWVSGALVAVAVATSGVALVGSKVTDSRPAPLSAGEIDRRLDALDATTTTVPGTPAPSDVGDGGEPTPDSTPVTTTVGVGSSPTTVDGTSVTTTTSDPTGATTTSTTTTTAPPPSTTVAPSETRTYNVEGGTVALRFDPSGVSVLYANPNAGYDVEIEPENGNGVKVEFENESHRSEVSGWWSGGPQDSVREAANTDD